MCPLAAGSSKKEGTGGREVKMKSTKKKGGRGRDLEDGSDEEGASPSAGSAATNGPGKAKQQDLKFLTVVEIEEVGLSMFVSIRIVYSFIESKYM